MVEALHLPHDAALYRAYIHNCTAQTNFCQRGTSTPRAPVGAGRCSGRPLGAV